MRGVEGWERQAVGSWGGGGGERRGGKGEAGGILRNFEV